MKVREKLTYSGDTLEPDFYLIDTAGRIYHRGKKKKTSRAAQKKLNHENAVKKLRRILEENFTEDDYKIDLTFCDDEMPLTYSDCQKMWTNFVRRLKRRRDKLGLPELKYAYSIECKVSKRTGVARFHFHGAISGGVSPKELRKIWGHGDINKIDNLQFTNKALEPLAKYMLKERSNELLPQGRKCYTTSQNLRPPKEKVKDGVFSAAYLERLCKERIDDTDFWERRYKGYRFIEAKASHNGDYGTWHLSVFMRKKE